MRAVVIESYGGPEVLRVAEVPLPEPAPDEVLVRVHATAVNRADLLQRRGRYPAPGPRPAFEIPGLEFAGVVERVGARVADVRPGERVMGILPGGGYAEYVATPAGMLLPVPEALSLEEAAAVPEVFLTAYDALFRQAGLRIGEAVLVHAGGSGVGTAATQLARAAGADVFTTVGSPEKALRSQALGAQLALVRERDDWVAAVREATGGRGADVVLELVGGAHLARDLEALAVGGRVVVIGTMGGAEATLPLSALMARRARVVGTVLRARSREEKVALTQEFRRTALALLARGVLRPVVDRTFPLAQAGEAHRYMEANRNFGKVVLTVRP